MAITLNSVEETAALIDHTILKPMATWPEIEKVVREGLEWKTASVCVNPVWARETSEILKGSSTLCCCVAGFPLGASQASSIAFEAETAVNDGAREIDMVLNVGYARMQRLQEITKAVKTIKNAIGESILKVILEVCYLEPKEIEDSARAILDGGAEFLKTSTGFGTHGATLESVQILSRVANGKAGVKAAGGIKGFSDVVRMVEAGATRIGASSTARILSEAKERFGD